MEALLRSALEAIALALNELPVAETEEVLELARSLDEAAWNLLEAIKEEV